MKLGIFTISLFLLAAIVSSGCSLSRTSHLAPTKDRAKGSLHLKTLDRAAAETQRSIASKPVSNIANVSYEQEVGVRAKQSIQTSSVRPQLTPNDKNLGVPQQEMIATPQSLTLEQAEDHALSTNPDLQKAIAEIARLEGKRVQVGLKPNPQFGYLSADVGEEQTAGQQGVFFSQEFIRGGKLQLNRSIVCQEINAAKQQLEINRQKLLTEVRQRFYDQMIAQERVFVARRFEQLAQDAVTISERLFEAEEISKIAYLRANIQAQNTTIVLKQAENNLAGARKRLIAVTGLAGYESGNPAMFSVEGEIYPNGPIADLDGIFERILRNSPELAQAAAELERAKWNLNRQIAEPTRNIQMQTGLTHGNVTGEDLVALQIGMPIRINDRNQGNIASARAEMIAQSQHLESTERDLAKRFSVAYRDYENARLQITRFQQDIIPKTSEFYELVASAFKEGELGYLDLVSAQQAYLDASLKNLDALRDFWRTVALLDGNLLSED